MFCNGVMLDINSAYLEKSINKSFFLLYEWETINPFESAIILIIPFTYKCCKKPSQQGIARFKIIITSQEVALRATFWLAPAEGLCS